jgi:hypothetical protein
MQHLKRRHKRTLEVEDSRTKKAQRISKEIHEVGSQPAPWWRTGQWIASCLVCTDCPVGHPDSLRREAHDGRSRSVAPDYLGNGRIQRSTATDPNGRLTWQAPNNEQCMSGAHRIVQCVRRQKVVAFCPMARSVGAIIPPTSHLEVGSPSNIPRHNIDICKCSYTQVLNRITRWLA